MDQPAESIDADDCTLTPIPGSGSRLRRRKRQATVRSFGVVVAQVLSEDPLQMALPEDQEVAQALPPCRLHEALGKGVRFRGADGRADDAHAVGYKYSLMPLQTTIAGTHSAQPAAMTESRPCSPRSSTWFIVDCSATSLIASSYAIDIAFGAFALAGIEHMPRSGPREEEVAETGQPVHAGKRNKISVAPKPSVSPWSHSRAMAGVWTALSMLISAAASRDRRTTTAVGLLAFSHWIVDFITKPMTAVYPEDGGLQLWPGSSVTLGLGLYRHRSAVKIVEYGSLALGGLLHLQMLAGKKVCSPERDAAS